MIDPVAFQIGPLGIRWYALCIVSGLILAVYLASKEAPKKNILSDDILDFILIAFPLAIIGARLYYVIFRFDYYSQHMGEIFAIWNGGLAIYGGLITGAIVLYFFADRRLINTWDFLDIAAPSVMIAQSLGRWGNFFNREAFGEYTDCLFAMRLPVDAVRPGDITELMRENMQRIDGVSYIQVHPTFLYESLWCAGLLIILFLYRKHKKYEGELFLMYLFGYGAGRVWIERLRTDQLVLPGIGFPVSELLAGCLVIMTGIMLIYCRRHCRKRNEKKKVDQYEPVPTKIKGKKPPKWDDRLFKNR